MGNGVINGGIGTNPPTTGNGLPTTPTSKWEELMLDIETELGGNLVDVELKLEYEMFIAIVKASPLSKSRRSAGIDMNRDEELLFLGL